MIPRYTSPEMAAIWSPETKFKNWLDIEILACEAMEVENLIPNGVAKSAREAVINIDRIDEIEKETRHDVIAFLTSITEQMGDEGRYLHQGMTSSDVVDTGFSMLLRASGLQIRARLGALLSALKKQAETHKETLCIGRSHGIHAEPTTFGLKMASHYAAFARGLNRLDNAIDDISVCALSGAVGTHATLPPSIQTYVAEKLDLKPEIISTQIIPRDRHATFFAVLGVIAGCIENLATEIRHLQRSEVREVEEFFNKGQKGSSAMPHKRNPVLSENLTGLARVIRGAVTPALENITLWHERDISHSSVERTTLPDACIACDFALERLTDVIDNLIVYPERMKNNIDALSGLIYSQKILLALTQKGVSRENAYKIIQENAMTVWDSGCTIPFKDQLLGDDRVTDYLNENDLDNLFNPQDYITHCAQLIDNALYSPQS
jgi:adenylosuccinate lyase